MSMTLTAMATEVARSIGGQDTAATVDLARTAIKASLQDWNAAKYWNFLLKDTSQTFTVTGVAWTGAVTSMTAPSSGAFDAVNIGVSVSGTNVPASTTVSSYTRASDGTVATIVLSAATTGTGVAVTLTFGANIPIQISVADYNLPSDFRSPYSARLLTSKRLLEYIKHREWNKKIVDQEATGAVDAYTIFNPVSPQTQNFNTTRLRIFRTPATTDTLHMQYFRAMNVDATTVDVPNDYIYMLIDYATWRFIRLKNTEDTRLAELGRVAEAALARAMTDDEEESEDEELRFISQIEAFNGGGRQLWSNGDFYPSTLDY